MKKNFQYFITLVALVLLTAGGTVADVTIPLAPKSNHQCTIVTKGPGDIISGCYKNSEQDCVGECYRRNSGTMFVGECTINLGTTCYPYLRQWSFQGTQTPCIDGMGGTCVCSDVWDPISGTIEYVDCGP